LADATGDGLCADAVDGRHAGTTLSWANDRSPTFWGAWRDFHPETDVYGSER
jgi:hypothetical protein